MYAVGEHLNYTPAIHKRVVSLVDKQFLLILDLLDEVVPDSSVQINFHIDCPTVMVDSEHRLVRSLSNEANIGIFSDGQTVPSPIPARISTRDDVAHDTIIARFEAEHLAEGRHGFVSVAYPVPAGSPLPEVTSISKEFRADGAFLVSFRTGGHDYRLSLHQNELTLLL